MIARVFRGRVLGIVEARMHVLPAIIVILPVVRLVLQRRTSPSPIYNYLRVLLNIPLSRPVMDSPPVLEGPSHRFGRESLHEVIISFQLSLVNMDIPSSDY